MRTVRRQRTKMAIVVVMTLLMTVLWSAQALAGAVVLTLVRTSALINVNDAVGPGLWQHESGNVLKGAAVVGQYALHRRVTPPGTSVQNTAMATVTLFFSGTGAPPQNVTIQGAHHFTNGRIVGSVSAGSNRYNWVQGADVVIIPTQTIGTSTLTISWTGASQLTLP